MHDLFDVLGLPSNASIGEIRRVCAERVRRSHPDFRAFAAHHEDGHLREARLPNDVAVEFIDVASLIDRIERSFFQEPA